MPRIADFRGGINRGAANHLINADEAPYYVNVDHVAGPLGPQAKRQIYLSDAQRFGHKFSVTGNWYWSDTPADFVEYQENLYISYRTGKLKKVVNGIEHNLGIEAPETPPILSAISNEAPSIEDLDDPILTIKPDTTADLPINTNLPYRFVNETADGKFSDASKITSINTPSVLIFDPSISIAVSRVDVRLTNLLNETAPVHAFRVYRQYLNEWRLVERVVVSENTHTVADKIFDISANDNITDIELGVAGGITGDEISYATTYYNSVDGTESVPVLSANVDVIAGFIELSQIPVSTDPQVDKKKIYRIGGGLTTYTLVTTLNNVETEYVDRAAADELPGDLLQSGDHFTPREGMKWLIEAYAMLFAASGDRLYFTPIGQPDVWPQTYFLEFPNTITGIGKSPIGLLIFTKLRTYLVTGTGPLSLAQQPLSASQGCINGDTVVNIAGGVMWASNDGLCASSGGKVTVYSRAKLEKADFSRAVNAVVHDDTYYLIEEDLDSAIQPVDDYRIWGFDLPRECMFNTLENVDSLIIASDLLLGHRDGNLFTIYGKKQADVVPSSDEVLEMFWWSPTFVGPGFTIPKLYKNIYVYSFGELQVDVYINFQRVQSVMLSTFDNHQIKVPDENTRGFSIHFVIRGTGTVYEITWNEGHANK